MERKLKNNISKIICLFIGHNPIKKFIDNLFEGIPDGGTELIICARCLKVISIKYFVEVSDKTKEQAIKLSRKYGTTEKEFMSAVLYFWGEHGFQNRYDPRYISLYLKYLDDKFKKKYACE